MAPGRGITQSQWWKSAGRDGGRRPSEHPGSAGVYDRVGSTFFRIELLQCPLPVSPAPTPIGGHLPAPLFLSAGSRHGASPEGLERVPVGPGSVRVMTVSSGSRSYWLLRGSAAAGPVRS